MVYYEVNSKLNPDLLELDPNMQIYDDDNLPLEGDERDEYAVIKKIMNNKLFKNIFRKVIKDENLKEKIKNKLIDIVKKRYGYIDRSDKLAEITNNFYDAMLEKLKETI